MKTTYLFINGINQSPGNINNWNGKACVWIDENTEFKSERYEYHADAVFRRLHQEARVDDLQRLINRFASGDVVLVGHSNGCDLIERLVKRNSHHFKEIHLIAAASENDFRKNGYNTALKKNTVGSIFIYMSFQDEALKQAKWSTRLFGWLGLGYGYLGLVGPRGVFREYNHRVNVIERKFSHSQWFDESNFNDTMKMVSHKV